MLNNALRHRVSGWGGPVWSQDLDSVIIGSPFHLGMFSDSRSAIQELMRSVESFKGKREHNTSRLQKRVFVNQTDDSFSSRATNSRDPLYKRGKRVVGM